MNQSKRIVNWTMRNKIWWNFNPSKKLYLWILQCVNLNFWSPCPNTNVTYIFDTKFHLPRPIFYSSSSKCTRIGERESVSFPHWNRQNDGHLILCYLTLPCLILSYIILYHIMLYYIYYFILSYLTLSYLMTLQGCAHIGRLYTSTGGSQVQVKHRFMTFISHSLFTLHLKLPFKAKLFTLFFSSRFQLYIAIYL